MRPKLKRMLFHLETLVLIVLLVVFARTVAAVRSGEDDPLAAVAQRHASNLVRRVNPEADSRAVELTALATRYALTRDSSVWHDLAVMAWRTRTTNEILTRRIQWAIMDESLAEHEKQVRVCEIVTGNGPVAVMPGSSPSVLSALSSLGVNPVQIRREDGLVRFESFALLVIGRNAMSGAYRDYYQALGPVLLEYVSGGGSILILSHQGADWAFQWLPGSVLPSNRPLKDHSELVISEANHPVLKAVNLSDIPAMQAETKSVSGTYPLACAVPMWKALAGVILDGTAEAVLAEIEHGKGRIALCQLAVDSEYGVCPSASALFDNLVRYLLRATPGKSGS